MAFRSHVRHFVEPPRALVPSVGQYLVGLLRQDRPDPHCWLSRRQTRHGVFALQDPGGLLHGRPLLGVGMHAAEAEFQHPCHLSRVKPPSQPPVDGRDQFPLLPQAPHPVDQDDPASVHRQSPCGDLQHHHPKAVHVGLGCGHAVVHVLRRQVTHRPRRYGHRPGPAAVLVHLGQAEIPQFGVELRIKHNVAALHISVNDLPLALFV
ncbi:hypothetical protein BT93_D0106 [Corymbia citriodora subsp. variegata]|nr:hypothetical protein BT93_D0106 [Corymbia citriodora subsp. variegata]